MKAQKTLIISALIVSFAAGYASQSGQNSKPTFGDQKLGIRFPENCRAIVASGMEGFTAGEYTAEKTLSSIDRNCGAYGYAWENNPGDGGAHGLAFKKAIRTGDFSDYRRLTAKREKL